MASSRPDAASPHFGFLATEWPELYDAATKAESFVHPDPRASCFYARRSLEVAVTWLYKNDRALRLPYQDQLNALIHEPTFRQVVGQAVFNKAKIIKDLGNQAVHSTRAIRAQDSLRAVHELFHVCYWLAHTYARGAKPAGSLGFDASLLPQTSPVAPQTIAQLQSLATQLAERDTRLSELLADRNALDTELQRLREEVAQTKAANAAQPDTHDYSEEETRDAFIDLLLHEAGWPLDAERDREFEVHGMPNAQETGYVDYVLWGDDGLPLALVEAKRTKRDPRVGQQQAKLYADCLEAQFGRRPIIFYSNGYEHWLWDDANHPPRRVQGFLEKAELELWIQRRETRLLLADTAIDREIVDRDYQARAIRRITETFERDGQRKALVVMATGAGKTRTVVALADLLMRGNWAKRVLFLADRVALVRQAVKAFKKHLPTSSPVNLVTERATESRVYVSTYPTMMRLIDEMQDGRRRFGVGHFDLIVIDEAHRSVYQKYRAIFEYFDALLVGLTATPKDEIDRNTYSLFELETGVPTDAYGLEDAVRDGWLVPSECVSVPLRFPREGIRYDDLSEDDKEAWDAVEWSDDGSVPTRVEAAAVNQWLFNKDTVDKVLEHLMTRGQKVAGGDRLGKTIVFAKNHAHAEFIADRFNANYPHYKGAFARVIDFQVTYAQSLIEDFSESEKAPHIAISVDMLDTGIDVPEVVNLVFFKLVRSRTKFWQMIGRGTRLRPDLFGPGKHKEFFYVFDYCQNLEFFNQNPRTVDGASGDSLGKRLFTTRLELIAALNHNVSAAERNAAAIAERREGYAVTEADLRKDLVWLLRDEIEGMNVDNFLVRPRRRLIEKYSTVEAWAALGDEHVDELVHDVAGLPSEFPDEDEDAKRFDLLMLRLQLTVLRVDPGFARLRDQVRAIAAMLEEKSSIPMVREHMVLIEQIQTDEYWQDVTTPMLEVVRRRLRALVKLIEKGSRHLVYTDFEDQIGDEKRVSLPGFGTGTDFERFRAKARNFLRAHEQHLTIHKLRMNEPLTPSDLTELERMLLEAGIGSSADIDRATRESNGLGHFVRSLIGMDREAAKRALGRVLAGRTQSANQIEFLDLIVEHLTEHGAMEPRRLYESPFTDINPQGPEGVFTAEQVDDLVVVLREIGSRAAA